MGVYVANTSPLPESALRDSSSSRNPYNPQRQGAEVRLTRFSD